MTYISWAAFHEGGTDIQYLDILIPRLIEEIILKDGIRHSEIPTTPSITLGKNGRNISSVAAEICSSQEAFEIVFIHADTGGRSISESIGERSCSYCDAASTLCDWPRSRCVTVTPRHETEAWILADPQAVSDALGYYGKPSDIGLPSGAAEAERLQDPKAVLRNAMLNLSGARRRTPRAEQLFPAIAQRQSFGRLRESKSFKEFEEQLRFCLADLGCILYSNNVGN